MVDSESISCVSRQQCQCWHLLFMSDYFKENESTCGTSPTLLVIFTARCREWAFSEMLRNGKCTEVLWLKRQTSERSLTTAACCGELVIPPTLKSDSLAQDSPLSLDAHVRQAEVIEDRFLFSELQQQIYSTSARNACPHWMEVVSP